MKIAIIGAGFTGLSSAYKLLKLGHDVTIFEKEKIVGGLAAGFKPENWSSFLEFHYHHLFTNDRDGINLMNEVEAEYQTLSPKTSILKNGKPYRFDSPMSLLKFPLLNLVEKMRVGFVIFIFKIIPVRMAEFLMESTTSFKLMPRLMGKKSFEILFEPLFKTKFGNLADKISAIWFFARIKKRTTELIYPKGGFQNFAEKIKDKIIKENGKIFLETLIKNVVKIKDSWEVETQNEKFIFDKIVLTLPFAVVPHLIRDFQMPKISHLDALNLILETDVPILDEIYWLNINDENYPFLAVIQQTNFVSKKNYGDNHICYLGNYLDKNHEFFKKNEQELLNLFLPKIQAINPKFKKENIIKAYLFRGVDAQPVVEIGYKKMLPEVDLSKMNKKFQGLYLANMDMVYPWDRGVNYAIELGEKVADIILSKS